MDVVKSPPEDLGSTHNQSVEQRKSYGQQFEKEPGPHLSFFVVQLDPKCRSICSSSIPPNVGGGHKSQFYGINYPNGEVAFYWWEGAA